MTAHIPDEWEHPTRYHGWYPGVRRDCCADPLFCPECGGAMRVVAFIEDRAVIRRILIHLLLREEPQARPPPVIEPPMPIDIEHVPCDG